MIVDILAELREATGYDEMGDSSVDALIDYKNALENRLYEVVSRLEADADFHAKAATAAWDPTVVDPEGELDAAAHTGRVEAAADAVALLMGIESYQLHSEGGS